MRQNALALLSGFLGYGAQIRVSPKNDGQFKDRIRELTRRNRGVAMTQRYRELGRYLRGWVGYFGLVPIKMDLWSTLAPWKRTA
jgi:RNA-directed DNA polymerase